MNQHDQLGFDLGWEHAENRVYPTNYEDTVVMDGYKAGLMKYGSVSRSHVDLYSDERRYVRKWLQLRRNAWKRHKFFSKDVTPDYLKYIDRAYCQITRIKLTHGTGQDTDWSVDRIDNDKDYIKGNLVVMSQRANAAKSELTINHLVRGGELRQIGNLTEAETRRLATLMYLTSQDACEPVPALVMPPIGIYVSPIYTLQWEICMMIAYTRHNGQLRSIDPGNLQFRSLLSVMRNQCNKVIEKIKSIAMNEDFTEMEFLWSIEDFWANNPEVFEAFTKWYNSRPQILQTLIQKRTAEMYRAARMRSEVIVVKY